MVDEGWVIDNSWAWYNWFIIIVLSLAAIGGGLVVAVKKGVFEFESKRVNKITKNFTTSGFRSQTGDKGVKAVSMKSMNGGRKGGNVV